MSMKIDRTESVIDGVAGGAGSEPGGRASRPAGGEPFEIPEAVRDRLSDEVIDELLAGARTEEEIVGPGGVLAQLTKRLVERAMSTELSEHLGYEPHQEPPESVTPATARRRRRLRPSTDRSMCERRAIATAALSRRSCGRGSGGS